MAQDLSGPTRAVDEDGAQNGQAERPPNLS
jgi:hypothetical protein